MQLPDFGSLTIYGLLAIVVWVITNLALKFFANASIKVRVGVFAAIFMLLAVPIVIFAMRFEWLNAPIPPGVPDGTNAPSGNEMNFLLGTAHAQSIERWIYSGEFDSARNRWLTAVLDIGSYTPETMRHRSLVLLQSVQVYDRPPSFSALSLRWSLGKQIATLSPNEHVFIESTRVVGKGRIWCRISP